MKKIARPNQHCSKCVLCANTDSVCISDLSQYPLTAEQTDYMLIGEAPGAEEERQQRAFVGKAGRTLRQALNEVGITRFYLANLIKCRLDNRDPELDEIKACAPYLAYEMRRLKPKVVITLGNLSTKAVLKKAQVTKIHGQITQKDGIIYMPTFNPSYVNRDPSTRVDFVKDLKKAKDTFEGQHKTPEFRWRRVTGKTIDKFLRDLERCSEFAFDTETTGLDWYSPESRINCIGFSLDTEKNWILPLPLDENNFEFLFFNEPLLHEIKKRLKGKPCVAHSEKFDNTFLNAKFGISFEQSDDTMLMHHLIDENKFHDLKSLSRNLLDAPEYDIPTKEKTKLTPKTMSYCAKDTAYTLQLKRILEPQLNSDSSLRKIYDRLTLPASKVLTRAEQRGFYILKDLFHQTIKKTRRDLSKLEIQLTKLAGREINWNSSQQISELLFDEIGLIPEVRTPKGAPSTSEAALRTFRKDNELVKTLFKYRELEKFRSTYLDGWIDLIRGDRIYFSTMIHGTVTGRFSSRLHTVPKDGTIRNLISAAPGWTFVQADFSQAELRTIAIVSRDPELLRCYQKNIDVHWRTLCGVIPLARGEYEIPALDTASKLAKYQVRSLVDAAGIMLQAGFARCKAIWPGWENARKKTKSVNFGFVYGQSARGFQEYARNKFDMDLELAEVELFRKAFFKLYRLGKWHSNQRSLVHLNGYVRNLFGRIRRLPRIHSNNRSLVHEAERQAINSPIQGFIGDFKTAALVDLANEFPQNRQNIPVNILGEVHDSILLEVETERLDDFLPTIREIMESPPTLNAFNIHLPIPMTVDMEIGPWGAGEPYNG